jgi:hypothetical protein
MLDISDFLNIIATLAIVNPEDFLKNKRQDALIEVLRESSHEISHDLGYQKKGKKILLKLPHRFLGTGNLFSHTGCRT